MEATHATALNFLIAAVLILWSAFWVIRLGVRYGVDDALRKHRELTRPQPSEELVA